MARCSLIDDSTCRVRQFPRWMLDAASCQSMRQAERPMADLGALMALRTLLGKVTATPVPARKCEETVVASPSQNRGDHHAPPPPARTPRVQLTVAAVREPRGTLVTVPDPARIDRPSDSLASRARERRDARSAERRR